MTLLDLSPLRGNRVFRRFWIGTSLQTLGGQIAAFAVLYQMWDLTRSPVMTGMVGLTLAVPMLIFGLWGGVMADTRDRRRLILLSNLGTVAFALCLVAQATVEGASPALLLALAAAQAGSIAIGQPARKAMLPDVLPREKVGAGIALSHASLQAAMLGGPAFAGITAGLWGVAACYAVQALLLVLSFYGLAALPKSLPAPSTDNRLTQLIAGIRAIREHPPLRGALLTDLAAMTLAMPVALFPALNEERFGGSPETLGLFMSAVAAGGIIAILLSGSITRHPRQGVLQISAALLWGLALTAAGLIESGWLMLVCLGVAGAADTMAVMTRGVIVQLSCASTVRGRVLAAEQVVGVAAPEIGNFRAGSMAAFLPPGAALACGGLLCMAAVVGVAASHPQLRRFRVGSA